MKNTTNTTTAATAATVSNMFDDAHFTAEYLKVSEDIAFPVEYSVAPNKHVFAFIDFDGDPVRVEITPEDSCYAEAMQAAAARDREELANADNYTEDATEAPAPEIPEEQPAADPVPEEIPEEITAEAAELEEQPAATISAADIPAEKHGRKPRKEQHASELKPWIGSEITGKTFVIKFDDDEQRTRIIFERKPAAAVIEAVKAAKFYWSPYMRSWNKGLTCKAYRAAQQLAKDLEALGA